MEVTADSMQRLELKWNMVPYGNTFGKDGQALERVKRIFKRRNMGC